MTRDKTEKRKRKKKQQNILLDYLAYLLLRITVVLLSMRSIESNLQTARFLGRCLWHFYHRGRNRALTNLRASFPEKGEKWIWNTGRRSFEHLAMLAIDTMFAPRLVRKGNWKEFSTYTNVERAKWMMKEQKGLIMVTGHYGNFELVGYLMGLFGFNIYSVARPLDNRFINRYLYDVRQRHSQRIIDKHGAAKLMDKLTETGATLGFIADQDAGRKGLFVDFFGRKASTYKSIGLIALTQNIPIVVGYCRRVDNKFFFEMGANRIIYPHEWADKDDPLTWVTQEYTKAIEDFIRQDPTQYWWLHRRWKHRPDQKRGKKKQSTTKTSPANITD